MLIVFLELYATMGEIPAHMHVPLYCLFSPVKTHQIKMGQSWQQHNVRRVSC